MRLTAKTIAQEGSLNSSEQQVVGVYSHSSAAARSRPLCVELVPAPRVLAYSWIGRRRKPRCNVLLPLRSLRSLRSSSTLRRIIISLRTAYSFTTVSITRRVRVPTCITSFDLVGFWASPPASLQRRNKALILWEDVTTCRQDAPDDG